MFRKHRWVRRGRFGICGMPDAPGVYVLFHGDKAVYVGSTTCLSNRLGSSGMEIYRRKTTCIAYRQSSRVGDWLYDEVRLIRRLRPIHNIDGVRNAKAPVRRPRRTQTEAR